MARIRASRELPEDATTERYLAGDFLRQITLHDFVDQVPAPTQRPGIAVRLLFWLAAGITLGVIGSFLVVLAKLLGLH